MAQTADYRIEKKRNGRYCVQKRGGGFINGPEKVEILLGKGLIKTAPPKKAAAANENPAEGGEGDKDGQETSES